MYIGKTSDIQHSPKAGRKKIRCMYIGKTSDIQQHWTEVAGPVWCMYIGKTSDIKLKTKEKTWKILD